LDSGDAHRHAGAQPHGVAVEEHFTERELRAVNAASDGHALADSAGDRDPLTLPIANDVRITDANKVALALPDGVRISNADGIGFAVAYGVAIAIPHRVRIPNADGIGLAVAYGVAIALAHGVPLTDTDGVRHAVAY
jgi:hypothetical protein